MIEITNDSVLKMLELRQRPEDEEEVLIGRPDISNFIVLPKVGVDIIEMLDAGQTVGAVAQEMEERLGEPVDVLSFAQDLVAEFQFVHTVDGTVVNEPVAIRDHLAWIKEGVGAFFFNRWSFTLYLLLFVTGMVLAITGGYFPHYTDIFISDSVTVSLVTAFVAGWLQLFFHETAHLMAARSLGIGSRIGLSHRLVFMVAETNMSNIVLVDPKLRYRAFAAGMGWDGALFGLLVLAQVAVGNGWLSVPAMVLAIMKMVNLTLLMGIAFQFMFYMKTDIYYMFTTRFNCKNLLHNTQLFLRHKIRRLSPAEVEEWEYVGVQEKRVIRWYVWFYVVGFLWAISFYAMFTLRQAIEFISRIVAEVSDHEVLSWPFLDGVLLIVITLVPTLIVLWSWSRTWQARRRQRRVTTQVGG